ncbi:hypothetical protein BJF82_14165 [Kytococcus sp. CUA-901]|nr:hypothetical protein BJF82_14165 [Kytococcus sp. CUA-901]
MSSFAAFTVFATFILGMAIAILMNDDRLKGKGIYRSLLILPYALPIYVTALVWASMFNPDFGLINNLFGLDINWTGNAWWARASVLITNLWLGFPYWFIVCTGALQAIPSDVKEAAQIDGAGAFTTIRRVIMPLLLVAVGPLMIASFAFNFNNFSLIWLLTEGGPFVGARARSGPPTCSSASPTGWPWAVRRRASASPPPSRSSSSSWWRSSATSDSARPPRSRT